MQPRNQIFPKFKPALLEKVFGKIPAGAKPHHSWHVLNIPKRTGYYPVEYTLRTMDECRISWAKIIQKSKVKSQNCNSKVKSGLVSNIIVEYQPLTIENSKFKLGESVEKKVWSEINDKAFVKQPKVGDWISLHWNWVCDFLTENQVENLQKWTKYNLALANL